METSSSGARLIIVCGLPGSGKTTHARQLQSESRAIRLCPDEWIDALSLDIWEESNRERVENLQWQLGQQLLNLGLAVIIEWGTWGISERDTLRLRARELGAAVELHYLSAPIRFLSIGARLCSTLPSDPISQRRPCASLILHLHQAG
jgi:predicted kinase